MKLILTMYLHLIDRNLSAEVYRTTCRNSTIFRFFSIFKDQTRDLESFYETYKYPFRPLEDTAVLELKLMTELQIRDVNVRDNFYLIPTARIRSKKYKANRDKVDVLLTPDDFLSHVAGKKIGPLLMLEGVVKYSGLELATVSLILVCPG